MKKRRKRAAVHCSFNFFYYAHCSSSIFNCANVAFDRASYAALSARSPPIPICSFWYARVLWCTMSSYKQIECQSRSLDSCGYAPKEKNCICKALKINLNKLSDRKKNFNLFFLILFAFHARHNGELIVISFAGPVIPTTNPLVYAKISCFQFEIIYLENKQKGSRVMRFQCGD